MFSISLSLSLSLAFYQKKDENDNLGFLIRRDERGTPPSLPPLIPPYPKEKTSPLSPPPGKCMLLTFFHAFPCSSWKKVSETRAYQKT